MTAPTPRRHRNLISSRAETVNRIDAMTVKVTRVSGYVLIVHDLDAASAEASVDISFPVVFTEKPVFTFGSELEASNHPLVGQYPTLSATVDTWKTVGEKVGMTEGRFVGCRVVTVSSGQVGQSIWLHYSFEGKAIRNPLNSVGGTNDTI